MKRTSPLWMAIGAVIIAVGGCSDRDGTRPPQSKPAAERGAAVGTGGAGANLKSDDEFVQDVAAKNMAELELSRMALDKSTSPEVRVFAQMMIRDHGAVADKLKNAVSGRAFDGPTPPDDKLQDTKKELAQKQGRDFDRDYVKASVEMHQDLAAKLESRLDVKSLEEWKTAAAGRTQRQTLPDPTVAMGDVQVRPNKSDDEMTAKVNQWAADTYPIAQQHLDAARALENTMKRGSTD